MYQFAAAQQTSTVKLPAFLFFFSFETKELVLRLNKNEVTSENAFNGNLFEIEDDHEQTKDEKIWFYVLLKICYQCFNRYTAKYLYLKIASIVLFLQFQAIS